jgi:glycosyltransferase involved in cell wall biosynthesis
MNVLQVTAYDNYGQAFGGYQLHRGLRALGHDSHLAVMEARFSEPEIHTVGNRLTRRIDRGRLAVFEDRQGLQQLLTLSGVTLHFSPLFHNADIVHLQLTHSGRFFSLLNVPLMSRRKPLVWSLHDPWMTTGHCVYPGTCDRWLRGCGSCPDLKLPLEVTRDRTAFMWKVKQWVMRHSRLTLVVASEWMREHVSRSPVLSHLPCRVIPYGVDADVFKTRENSRARFGIPEDSHVLAFRHPDSAVNYKGGEYVERALLELALTRPTHLIVFEGRCPASLKGKYSVTETGWTDDQSLIADALSASDAFLMPSTAEAFGQMSVESMSCGTPVIVFDGTALPGVVKGGGLVVPHGDAEGLKGAIERVLYEPGLRESLSLEGVRLAREEYGMRRYVESHVRLYEELISTS